MYSQSDLKWVKNVKRAGGKEWAYEGLKVGGKFELNWSHKFKGNVLRASIGDLILLFQTVNNPKGTYLTHIVTPLSNNQGYDVASSHPHTRLVGVVAVADPIFSIPKPKEFSFYVPNRGAVCTIDTIKEIGGSKSIPIKILQSKLWGIFHNKTPEIQDLFDYVTNDKVDDDVEYMEGTERILLKEHKFYERNNEVVRKAKENAKKEGRLFCEVCRFDFAKKYPKHGDGFIECHHTLPIAKGGIRKTEVNDLALVCSNCHRMLHRKSSKGNYYTVEELKKLFFK